MTDRCRCCGRLMSQHSIDSRVCDCCGMFVFEEDSPGKALAAISIAKSYKEYLLKSIADISVVMPGDMKLLKICDGIDCFERIVWSKELLHYSCREEWSPAIDIRLKVSGKNRRLLVLNPREEDENLYKIGVAIDRKLRLITYFGDENFNLSSGPYAMEL